MVAEDARYSWRDLLTGHFVVAPKLDFGRPATFLGQFSEDRNGRDGFEIDQRLLGFGQAFPQAFPFGRDLSDEVPMERNFLCIGAIGSSYELKDWQWSFEGFCEVLFVRNRHTKAREDQAFVLRIESELQSQCPWIRGCVLCISRV